MESIIKVVSTPDIIRRAVNDTSCVSIRLTKPISFYSLPSLKYTDPAPYMEREQWYKEYGDIELIYKVYIRYPEGKPLSEKVLYKSWNNVLEKIKRGRR